MPSHLLAKCREPSIAPWYRSVYPSPYAWAALDHERRTDSVTPWYRYLAGQYLGAIETS
jgi:hypothetical protein